MLGFLWLALTYVIGFFVVAPLASLLGSTLSFLALKAPFGLSVPTLDGLLGSLIAYFSCFIFFNFMDVEFHWWSYLICILSVVLNEGQRVVASRADGFGPREAAATGCMLGIVIALVIHFTPLAEPLGRLYRA